MYVFGSGRCGWKGGEWMRELCLGFTNPVGTGGVSVGLFITQSASLASQWEQRQRAKPQGRRTVTMVLSSM